MRKRTAIAGVSLVASFVLMITAIGNAVALYTKAADNAHFNIGAGTPAPETVDYYLVGSGSFVKSGKSDWSTDGGIQMYAHSGDRGALLNLYLTAGDVFKITDGADEWYGWGNKADGSDETHFRTAYYNHITIGNTAKWIGNSQTADYTLSNYNGTNGITDVLNGTNRTIYWTAPSWWTGNGMKGNQIKYYDSTDVYCSATSLGAGVYSASVPLKSNGGFEIYRWNSGDDAKTGWITASNLSNGNIVVAESGYYNIYLNNDSSAKVYISQVS